MPNTIATGRIWLNVVDGTRQMMAMTKGMSLFVTAIDGNGNAVVRKDYYSPNIELPLLPIHGNLQDYYRVIVSAKEYRQAEVAAVHLDNQVVQIVDLMLIPEQSTYSFTEARWAQLKDSHPELLGLINAGIADAQAADRYTELLETKPDNLACFLNITTAMRQINLPSGTSLEYLCELIWDDSMKQDRFFAWARPNLLDQVRTATTQGTFAEKLSTLHPGATCSYKQITLENANAQFTFHENDKKTIGGAECIKVELDIDYDRDTIAHAVREVIPNAVTRGKTDPKNVYVLRWMAGRRAGLPEFAPPYTIIKA